ncbi:MAG: formate dehydrogenase, partial [Armatimonadetes bacterium OLB18]
AIWDEVRSLWPVGAGLSYARLEKGGLQWPCPTEDHPGTTVLHKDRFPTGERTALKQITYIPSLRWSPTPSRSCSTRAATSII